MKFYGLTCIVDDNADYRTLIQLFFKRSCPEYPIRAFINCKTFLEALDKMSQLPSLILLDRHMPEFDGHQTLEFLKHHPRYKRIPVVMMSGDATKEEIDGCYGAGVNLFLKKSLDSTCLRESLSTVCRYWLELNQAPKYGLIILV